MSTLTACAQANELEDDDVEDAGQAGDAAGEDEAEDEDDDEDERPAKGSAQKKRKKSGGGGGRTRNPFIDDAAAEDDDDVRGSAPACRLHPTALLNPARRRGLLIMEAAVTTLMAGLSC